MNLPRTGDLFQSRYRVDDVLGEGGFSTVFAAFDLAAERPVALKILKPQSGKYLEEVSSRFKREVRVVASLRDPHTVTMYDFGTADSGLLYMVFEYVPGHDLSTHMQAHGAVPEAGVAHILAQVLRSLREAHRAGLLHRDIKPENIRVYEYAGDPLRVKLLDFGIARPAATDVSRITRPGELIGTPRYMSPEQLLEKELTPASDLYSLGLVTVELLLGRALLHGNSWSDQLQRLKDGHVFELPGSAAISERMRRVVLKMSARDVDQRYRLAEHVLEDLGFEATSESVVTHQGDDIAIAAPTKAPAAFELATTKRRRRESSAAPSDQRRGRSPWYYLLIALVMSAAAMVVAAVTWFASAPEHAEETERTEERRVTAVRPVESLPFVQSTTPESQTNHATDERSEIDPLDLGELPGSSGCGRPQTQRGQVALRHLDGLRHDSYTAYIPSGYDPHHPHPVIFLFRDAGQELGRLIHAVGFGRIAEEHGVVLFAPDSAEVFDGTGLFLSIWEDPRSLDVVEQIWANASQQLCLDRSRVFAVGHGAGGYAAERMACEFPVAAIATNAHIKLVTDLACEPDPPVPYIMMLGTDDGYVPREGGLNCSSSDKLSWTATRQRWAAINGCGDKRSVQIRDHAGTCYTWDCATAFVRCELEGGKEWSGTRPMMWEPLNDNCGGIPADFPAVDTIWSFFADSPRRTAEPFE